MKTFDFIPADTLFCRDARPLSAGSGQGHGANWPLPTVLHSALRTALLRAAGGLPSGRQEAGTPRKGKPTRQVGSTAFQWLHLHGPFPVSGEALYFPRPRDLVSGAGGHLEYLRLEQNGTSQGANNLPPVLTHMVASRSPPSKESLAEWVSSGFLEEYLSGKGPLSLPQQVALWDTEPRIGVALDDSTHTAAEGKLYAAEHLRLRRDVKLRFALSDQPGHKGAHPQENGVTTEALKQGLLQLGGEQRFGLLLAAGADLKLPRTEIRGREVKWLLLTPAIFAHGWRPGWVDESGRVKLRVVDKGARREFRRGRREAGWRYDESQDAAPPIGARLVSACLGKPQVVGGWDVLGDSESQKAGGGRPTHLAVPSGSVFYFLADSPEEAVKLAAALHDRCRSDRFGEKGLGLGICGTWKHQQPPTSP